MRSLGKTVRYGLLMQRILGRLKRVGLDINPYYLIREGLPTDEMTWPELATDFPGSILEMDDIPAIAACTHWVTVDLIHDRLSKGHLCMVLKYEGKIAGYTWAEFAGIGNADCDFVLRSGEAYLYDAFIVPDYRGRGLASYMRFECYERLRKVDKYTFYSISDYFNNPAIRFKQKLNAELIRLYLQVKVGSFEVGHWLLKGRKKEKNK